MPMLLNCFILSVLTCWLLVLCTKIQLLPGSQAGMDGLVSSPLSLNLNPQLTLLPSVTSTGSHWAVQELPLPQNRAPGTRSGAFPSLFIYIFKCI